MKQMKIVVPEKGIPIHIYQHFIYQLYIVWSEIWCQAVDASVGTHLYKKFTYNTCFLKKDLYSLKVIMEHIRAHKTNTIVHL